MRALSALFILSFITLSSCDKWEEKDAYYSTDFKPFDL
tara:strand:+ start:583 stop:696 length:114 start_codon:yes stop_codon:yes gene_type:complete